MDDNDGLLGPHGEFVRREPPPRRRTTDAHGNLAEVVEFNDTNGTSYSTYATTTYTYDNADRLKTVNHAGANVTTISYDVAGRKTQLNDRGTGVWNYGYDANSNLTLQSHVGSGRHLTMTYDLASRPLDTHAGPTIASDPNGRARRSPGSDT